MSLLDLLFKHNNESSSIQSFVNESVDRPVFKLEINIKGLDDCYIYDIPLTKNIYKPTDETQLFTNLKINRAFINEKPNINAIKKCLNSALLIARRELLTNDMFIDLDHILIKLHKNDDSVNVLESLIMHT